MCNWKHLAHSYHEPWVTTENANWYIGRHHWAHMTSGIAHYVYNSLILYLVTGRNGHRIRMWTPDNEWYRFGASFHLIISLQCYHLRCHLYSSRVSKVHRQEGPIMTMTIVYAHCQAVRRYRLSEHPSVDMSEHTFLASFTHIGSSMSAHLGDQPIRSDDVTPRGLKNVSIVNKLRLVMIWHVSSDDAWWHVNLFVQPSWHCRNREDHDIWSDLGRKLIASKINTCFRTLCLSTWIDSLWHFLTMSTLDPYF